MSRTRETAALAYRGIRLLPRREAVHRRQGRRAARHHHPAWTAARAEALTEEEQTSPLAKRIYDLRHACLSPWLNAGVPPTQVAAWAGHSVEVLLRIYAKCIDGQDAIAMRRITEALREQGVASPAPPANSR